MLMFLARFSGAHISPKRTAFPHCSLNVASQSIPPRYLEPPPRNIILTTTNHHPNYNHKPNLPTSLLPSHTYRDMETARMTSAAKKPYPAPCKVAPLDEMKVAWVKEGVTVRFAATLVILPTDESDLTAGASQCQWSPCCSQPTDSVGLGAIVTLSAPVPVVVTVAAGASQCQCSDKDCGRTS